MKEASIKTRYPQISLLRYEFSQRPNLHVYSIVRRINSDDFFVFRQSFRNTANHLLSLSLAFSLLDRWQRNGKSDVSIVDGKNHSRIRTVDAGVSIARARVPSRRSIDTRSKLFLFLEYFSKIASVRDSRFNLDQLEETFRRRIVFESTIAIKVHPLDKPSKLSRHPA